MEILEERRKNDSLIPSICCCVLWVHASCRKKGDTICEQSFDGASWFMKRRARMTEGRNDLDEPLFRQGVFVDETCTIHYL
jgi:hypothetical protein